MNAIQLDPHAAMVALDRHMATLRRLRAEKAEPYRQPAWLTQPAIPVRAWSVDGAQPADRKQARETALLYLFEFKTPQEIGTHTLAGYVLSVNGDGSCTSHWWQGQAPEVAAACAVKV